jgi:hypothetical protein
LLASGRLYQHCDARVANSLNRFPFLKLGVVVLDRPEVKNSELL